MAPGWPFLKNWKAMDDKKPNRSAGETPWVPKGREQAVVRCEGFQCLAYKGKDGKWHSAADDTVLDVLEIVLRL